MCTVVKRSSFRKGFKGLPQARKVIAKVNELMKCLKDINLFNFFQCNFIIDILISILYQELQQTLKLKHSRK